MADDEELDLEDLGRTPAPDQEMTVPDDTDANAMADSFEAEDDTEIARTASDLEAVFDIPVHVTAVLGKSRMRVSQLLKLGRGAVIELDRKVGEAIVWQLYAGDRSCSARRIDRLILQFAVSSARAGRNLSRHDDQLFPV